MTSAGMLSFTYSDTTRWMSFWPSALPRQVWASLASMDTVGSRRAAIRSWSAVRGGAFSAGGGAGGPPRSFSSRPTPCQNSSALLAEATVLSFRSWAMVLGSVQRVAMMYKATRTGSPPARSRWRNTSCGTAMESPALSFKR